MLLQQVTTARRALRLVARETWSSEGEVAPGGEGDPVLLLHGFCGTPPMMRPLARFLRRELGRPVHVAALGLGLDDIRDQALRASELIEDRIGRCDVVAYSMGGLVATYLLKCIDQGRAIRRVVTLGTPHGGVPLLSRWPAALPVLRSLEQLRRDSPLLARLARLPLPPGAHLLSIAGAEDTLVPPGAARPGGSEASGSRRTLVVPGVDHWSLITSRRVYRCVARSLAGPRAVRAPREGLAMAAAGAS